MRTHEIRDHWSATNNYNFTVSYRFRTLHTTLVTVILRVLESVLPQSSVTVNERSLFPKERAPLFRTSPEKNNRMLLTLLWCSFHDVAFLIFHFSDGSRNLKTGGRGAVPARYIFWGLKIVLMPLQTYPMLL